MPASVFHVFKYFFFALVTGFVAERGPSSGHQRDAVGRVSWFANYFWGKGSTDLRPVGCQRQANRDNAYYVWNVKLHNALSCKTKLFFAFGVSDE